MDEAKLKELCDSARSMRGVILRHQKLRVHANGAKFTIPRNYLDDELLSQNSRYTMILVPEADEESSDDQFFEGVTYKEVEYEFMGATMSMVQPYLVLESSSIAAHFSISLAKLKSLDILPKNVQPVQVAPGRGAVSISCQEYKKFNLDPKGMLDLKVGDAPYNQCNIGVRVSHAGAEGDYFIDMFFSNQQWALGSQSVNNFPTTFAEAITFTDDGLFRTCQVHSDGKPVLTLKVKCLPHTVRVVKSLAFSQREGHLLMWHDKVKGNIGDSNARDAAELVLGDHEAAQRLQELDLKPHAIWTQYAPSLKGIHGPREILEKIE